MSNEEFALTVEPVVSVTVAFICIVSIPDLLPYILIGCGDSSSRIEGVSSMF